jgi:hypothetical protein
MPMALPWVKIITNFTPPPLIAILLMLREPNIIFKFIYQPVFFKFDFFASYIKVATFFKSHQRTLNIAGGGRKINQIVFSNS